MALVRGLRVLQSRILYIFSRQYTLDHYVVSALVVFLSSRSIRSSNVPSKSHTSILFLILYRGPGRTSFVFTKCNNKIS
ncbi:hypothetical protein NY2A_b132L [Paramecium bursaria Chlorella virus NY2A]|uniref:Uncharacterized protein b132L n=1 Tax=Paramecium bursaria Chlorella virus NY2A TaxID=46021 RepID=A7IW07_PBCVN|nr:hypothetical protein NY2A_b132L [Paramecium bursaria Chlorella virus NY2A]ABT14531.1 hypothetical protein NY2A_b132L [Paramecium bursaria Chlorella virus NY2A]